MNEYSQVFKQLMSMPKAAVSIVQILMSFEFLDQYRSVARGLVLMCCIPINPPHSPLM